MALRVLVVDDAAFMRLLIKKILTELGHEVIGEAGDGEEACEMYDTLRPDLTTLDLIMPKKGGLDALRDIRAKHPRAQIIIISAIDQRQPLLDAVKLGASDFLVKPFERERVEQALNRVVACEQGS